MDSKLQELIDLYPDRIIMELDASLDYSEYNSSSKIIVLRDKNPHKRFSALTHEMSHADCERSGCLCRSQEAGHYYREYHAFRAQLVGCFDNIPALRESVLSIEKQSADFSCGHTEACQRLMTTKLWRKALKLVGG